MNDNNLLVDYASVDGDSRPNLVAAAAAGLGGAFVRADYSTWIDPTAARDRDAIRAAGLVFGAYMFPVMNVGAPTPAEQVKAFWTGAGLVAGKDIAPVIDLEWAQGILATGRGKGRIELARPELAEWIRQAVYELEDRAGCSPIPYCSARVLDSNDTDTLAGAADHVLAGLPPWLARYVLASRQRAVLATGGLAPPPVPRAFLDADNWWFRQYQGDALGFPGFSSTVDCDVYHPLAVGAHGERVGFTQRRVGADPDNGFGPLTLAAVKAFQARSSLAPTGVVDLRTFAAVSWQRAA